MVVVEVLMTTTPLPVLCSGDALLELVGKEVLAGLMVAKTEDGDELMNSGVLMAAETELLIAVAEEGKLGGGDVVCAATVAELLIAGGLEGGG